jgi:Zn-finger nucleic acid-binding protein
MVCPKCNNEMTEVTKHGVTIKTCAACGGVWLDKGGLGELLSRIKQAESSLDQELLGTRSSKPEYDRSYYHEKDNHSRDHYDEHDHDHDDKYRHRKRSLWEMFD